MPKKRMQRRICSFARKEKRSEIIIIIVTIIIYLRNTSKRNALINGEAVSLAAPRLLPLITQSVSCHKCFLLNILIFCVVTQRGRSWGGTRVCTFCEFWENSDTRTRYAMSCPFSSFVVLCIAITQLYLYNSVQSWHDRTRSLNRTREKQLALL